MCITKIIRNFRNDRGKLLKNGYEILKNSSLVHSFGDRSSRIISDFLCVISYSDSGSMAASHSSQVNCRISRFLCDKFQISKFRIFSKQFSSLLLSKHVRLLDLVLLPVTSQLATYGIKSECRNVSACDNESASALLASKLDSASTPGSRNRTCLLLSATYIKEINRLPHSNVQK